MLLLQSGVAASGKKRTSSETLTTIAHAIEPHDGATNAAVSCWRTAPSQRKLPAPQIQNEDLQSSISSRLVFPERPKFLRIRRVARSGGAKWEERMLIDDA